jgi:hypothetical protein
MLRGDGKALHHAVGAFRIMVATFCSDAARSTCLAFRCMGRSPGVTATGVRTAKNPRTLPPSSLRLPVATAGRSTTMARCSRSLLARSSRSWNASHRWFLDAHHICEERYGGDHRGENLVSPVSRASLDRARRSAGERCDPNRAGCSWVARAALLDHTWGRRRSPAAIVWKPSADLLDDDRRLLVRVRRWDRHRHQTLAGDVDHDPIAGDVVTRGDRLRRRRRVDSAADSVTTAMARHTFAKSGRLTGITATSVFRENVPPPVTVRGSRGATAYLQWTRHR